MPNGTYGGVRGRKTKVGRKLLRFPPTRFRPSSSPLWSVVEGGDAGSICLVSLSGMCFCSDSLVFFIFKFCYLFACKNDFAHSFVD